MKIRLAQIEDVPAILAISNWAALKTPANFAIEPESLESWQHSFNETNEKFPWLVACDDAANDTIIGFAKASPHRGRCAYAWTAETSVYIHHNHQGQGIGTALYNRLIPLLKRQGFVTLIAGITLPNPASQTLHESFGFKHIGTFTNVGYKFNQWHDVGFWQTNLRDPTIAPSPLLRVREIAQVNS